jgi:hypothetical protein
MPTTTTDTTGPRQVGRYELLEQLGAGGMGVVYRARDPQLDRVVAVKLPLFEGTPEQRALRVQRFQREARAVAKVAHPHVCAIYDVGDQDGQPFVVMAYLPGPSLADRLKSGGRFEQVGEAVRIAQQVLAALGAVHAHGIVHRDVKPGNILFDADGKAVLTDFGLARPEEAGSLTSEGMVLGTPAYMAPEQADGQLDRVGPWTDLYAVGVVLYHMVTGRLPFDGTPLSVLPRIVHEEPPRPGQVRPDLGPALETVILRALRKEPSERFQEAGAFAAALADPAVAPVPLPAPDRRSVQQSTAAAVTMPLWRKRWAPGRVMGWAYGDLFVLQAVLYLCLAVVTTASDMSRSGVDFNLAALLTGCGALLGRLGVYIWRFTEAGYTPEGLLAFARYNQCERARRAIARGVPVNARNELGETPLLLAVSHGQTALVKLLLLSGADPTIPDRLGQTARSIAVAKGHREIEDMLNRYAGVAGPCQASNWPVRRWSAGRRLVALVVLSVSLLSAGWYYASHSDPNFHGPGNWVLVAMFAWPFLCLGVACIPGTCWDDWFPLREPSAQRHIGARATSGRQPTPDSQQ